MNDEIWKPVVGYEGRYEVSNYGNLIRLPIKIFEHSEKWSNPREKNLPKMSVRGRVGINGYRYYCLSNQVKRIERTAHSLVMRAFVGERPEGWDIDHLDGDKLNNKASNLQYVTKSLNAIRGRHCLKKRDKSSSFPWVQKKRNKWASGKHVSGRKVFVEVGHFDTETEAWNAICDLTDSDLREIWNNRQKNRGLTQRGGKWRAAFWVKRKPYDKLFKTKEEAINYRDSISPPKYV